MEGNFFLLLKLKKKLAGLILSLDEFLKRGRRSPGH
jgi:hypothetical protein